MTNTRADLLDSLAKPPPSPSELDQLIARDPLDLASQDIDKLIAYYRQDRARRSAPARSKKLAPGESSGIDLTGLTLAHITGTVVAEEPPTTPTPALKPASSFRRL